MIDGSDADSNLIQRLKLQGPDNSAMLKWMTRQQNKHPGQRNQNEMLEIMAQMVVHSVVDVLSSSAFVAIMVDETTDKSNKEQLTLVLRWMAKDFIVSEEFFGLYALENTDATTIISVVLDALLRFQVPLSKIQG